MSEIGSENKVVKILESKEGKIILGALIVAAIGGGIWYFTRSNEKTKGNFFIL